MKVVAFNGSARKDGNTAQLILTAFEELESAGIETELVQLSGKILRGCQACYKCFEAKDNHCILSDDLLNVYVDMMADADGIILASPVYFSNVSSEMKALIDRAGMVARANTGLFRRKVGAGIVAVRRTGAMFAFDALNHFFLINEMIVAGSSYWNVGMGRNIGEVNQDLEGIKTMRDLGANMAWLLDKLGDQ